MSLYIKLEQIVNRLLTSDMNMKIDQKRLDRTVISIVVLLLHSESLKYKIRTKQYLIWK